MTSSQRILARAIDSLGSSDFDSPQQPQTGNNVWGQAGQTLSRTIRDLPGQMENASSSAEREFEKLPGELKNAAEQIKTGIFDPLADWYNESPWAEAVGQVAKDEAEGWLEDKLLTRVPGSWGAVARDLETLVPEVLGMPAYLTIRVIELGYNVWSAHAEIEAKLATRGLDLEYQFGKATFNGPSTPPRLGGKYDFFEPGEAQAMQESLSAEKDSQGSSSGSSSSSSVGNEGTSSGEGSTTGQGSSSEGSSSGEGNENSGEGNENSSGGENSGGDE
jgi:hypothetical protein